MRDYADLDKRLRDLDGHNACDSMRIEAAAALASLKERLRLQANIAFAAIGEIDTIKRGVLTAIDEERLCDDCDNDEDRAYQRAVADCYAAVERFLSRAQPGQDDTP